MASHEDFYTQPSSRPLSQTQFTSPPFTSDTPPPPPPPKPGSHDTSGRGTPQLPQSPLTQLSFDRPPPPLPIQSADTLRPLPPTPSTPFHPTSQSNTDNSNLTLNYTPSPRLPSPFLPESLPSKSTSDLAPVLSDPRLLSALASTHPSHAQSIQPLTTALDTNLTLAMHLLSLQTHLTALRDQTQQLLLQHTTLSTQWRRKQAEMDIALQPWSPKAMYARLVSGIAEQEAIVRAVEESFLEDGVVEHYGGVGTAGEREVGDWIRRIREGTAVLERRRESRARWDEGRVGGWR